MKKIVYTIIISFGIFFASCDYVSNPYPIKNANVGDTASCSLPTFPLATTHVKKILIEDFTGHVCPNCPFAATKLEKLDSTYSPHIIGIAEHVDSYFALPHPGFYAPNPTSFSADYRTPVGVDYNTTFGPEAAGNFPTGMINRRDFSTSGFPQLKNYPGWEAYLTPLLTDPSEVDLQLGVSYSSSTRKICCAVRDSFLTNRNDSLKLVVLLTQDSIVDWQVVGGPVDSNYVFMHVLRDALSGSWGVSLTNGTTPIHTKHITKFAYKIPADFNGIACIPKHCHLVAFIYKTSNYEIIQSEEAKVVVP